MKFRSILAIALLASGCSLIRPPRPTPLPPEPPPPIIQTVNIACIVSDARTHVPVEGALCDINENSGLTNGDGYFLMERIAVGEYVMHVSRDGYEPFAKPVDVRDDENIAVAITPIAKPRPTREMVLDVKANFISMRDARGRVMLSWFWPSLPEDEKADWENRWRDAGLTHVVLCPVMQYPNYDAPGGDWRGDPRRFAAAVTRLLDDGFIPIIEMTSGDGGTGNDVETYWPALLMALSRELDYVMLSPGFEVVGPGGGWSSSQLAHGLQVLHRWNPAVIGVHLQPERATGSSHPVERDDPWRGDEAGFWISNGGEFADVLLYQTPHGSKLLSGDGWEDRWIEILDRLGLGTRGWRKVKLVMFEKTGYDYFHGRATDDDVVRTSNRAQQLCVARGVVCGFGDGLPR